MTDSHEDVGDDSINNYKKNLDDTKLYHLIEMFPEKSIDYLSNTLISANDDLELAVSMVISGSLTETNLETDNDENTHPSENDDINNLVQMFPNIGPNIIKSYYNSKGNSIQGTTTELLNFELLSVEDIDDQRRVEERIKKLSNELGGKAWHSFENHINSILKYTRVSYASAKRYYYKNHFNPTITIISIIHQNFECHSYAQNNKIPDPNQKRKLAGRVQSKSGFAYIHNNSKSNNPKSSESSIELEVKPWSNRKFMYSTTAPEVTELEEIVSSNRDFKSINPVFLTDALKYYNGDVPQTIDLLMFLISNDGSKFTFLTDANDGFMQTSAPQVKRPLSRNKINTNPNNRGNKEPTNDQLSHLFDTFRLDFHGLQPSEAVNILLRGLDIWWKAEIEQRELTLKRLNLVNVCCVQPLLVITGRGIHSLGGISNVRIQVRKTLKNSSYVFDEGPSFFTIYGKRTR